MGRHTHDAHLKYNNRLGHAAPKIVVCSSGTSRGTQEMVEGLVLVFTLPYSSGPLAADASMSCSTQLRVKRDKDMKKVLEELLPMFTLPCKSALLLLHY